MRERRLLLVAAGTTTILGCVGGPSSRHPPSPRPDPPRTVAASGTAEPGEVQTEVPHDREPAQRATPPKLHRLPVEGFGPAVVSIPSASDRRPLLVVAHGAGGRPEWHCELWQRVVGNRGFVLCPRGRRIDRRVPYSDAGCYFPDHHFLTEVVNASRASLANAYEEHLDPSGAVFAGYSQGATMGALMVAKVPVKFPRALFIEGGGAQWNVPIAVGYRRGGGQRLAFLCGAAGCAGNAATGRRWLEQAGIAVRVVRVPGAGHTAGGTVAQRLPELFEWLIEDDSRWAADQ